MAVVILNLGSNWLTMSLAFGTDHVAAGYLQRCLLKAQILIDSGNAGVAIKRHDEDRYPDSVSLKL
jgi:hypothetical protein